MRKRPSKTEALGAGFHLPYLVTVVHLSIAMVTALSFYLLCEGGEFVERPAAFGADRPPQGAMDFSDRDVQSPSPWQVRFPMPPRPMGERGAEPEETGLSKPASGRGAPTSESSRPVSGEGRSGVDSRPDVPSGRLDTALEPDLPAENRLTDIRASQHQGFCSIVFEFTGPVEASHFRIDGNTFHFALNHTETGLKPFCDFKHVDSWVRIQPEGTDLAVSMGIPKGMVRRRTFSLTEPNRLVFNLYDSIEKADAVGPVQKSHSSPVQLASGREIAARAPSSGEGSAAPDRFPLSEGPSPVSGKSASTAPGAPQGCDLRQMDLIEARILSRQGLYEKALRLYERLREQYPDDEEIWGDFIETLVNSEAYELALLEIRNLLSKNPANLRGQRIQARIYQELNQPQWTFPLFEGLLDDYETDVGLWSDYAYTRLDSGDWTGALNYYCKVLELDPDNESALRSVHEILKKHRPALVPGYMSYYQEGDDSLIQTFSLGYGRDVGRKTRLNMDYQQVRIRRPDQPATGYSRVQETLHDLTALIRHRLGYRWQGEVGGSLYSGLGGGPSGFVAVDYEFPRKGVLRGSYVYHRPWFDPVEAAAREGNFNQARISLNWSFDPWWSLLARGTRWDYFAQRRPRADASRYGERHAFLGILTRRLMARPALSVSYSYYHSNFHYQYARFRPIDMLESERIHSLSFNLEDQPCTYLGYGLSGGIRRHTVKQTYSWFAFPFIKLRLGNRIDAVLSYEYSSEADTPQGGTAQTLNLSARVIL